MLGSCCFGGLSQGKTDSKSRNHKASGKKKEFPLKKHEVTSTARQQSIKHQAVDQQRSVLSPTNQKTQLRHKDLKKSKDAFRERYGNIHGLKVMKEKSRLEDEINRKKTAYEQPTEHVESSKYNPDLNENVRSRTAKMFRKQEALYDDVVKTAARTEYLLTEQSGFVEAEDGELTSDIRQSDITKAVDITSAQKHFDLDLRQFGPYRLNYSRNGRHLLLGGAKGHVAAFDWQTKKLACEINVMETCHDVKWLHNETLFAVAQKTWVYLYDNQGIELHCLKGYDRVLRLEFLPYHFLLCGANETGFIRWIDTSMGKDVAGFHTNRGRLDVMCQNRTNAIIHLGHANGRVTLWSPNIRKPVVEMLCHTHGAIRSVAVDHTGTYMATASVDRTIKIWDMRNSYQEVFSSNIRHGAGSLSFSQRGLLAAGIGDIVQTYKDPCRQPIKDVYLQHRCRSPVQNLQFVPYEDVLGAAHINGFTSVLVPGSGEPHFDALEDNPYQTKKQRQHGEVKMLLDKIQPEMITLEKQSLLQVNQVKANEEWEKQKAAFLLKPKRITFKPRYRKKGASKATRVEFRKQGMKALAKRETIKTLKQQKIETALSEKRRKEKNKNKSDALSRFLKVKDTG